MHFTEKVLPLHCAVNSRFIVHDSKLEKTMNIQDRIVKAIIVIQEAGQGLTKTELQSTLLGKQCEAVETKELNQLNSFGICEGLDEEDWDSIIDKAVEEGLLKVKNQKQQTLTYTPEGKRFKKKPHSVSLGDGDERDYNGEDDPELLAMMRGAMYETQSGDLLVKSSRGKRQIKLLQAIDRKIALDEFAEGEHIDLDDVLDDLDALKASGKRFDITYFIDEVIGQDDVDEFRQGMKGQKFNLDAVRTEWGDVYNDEELRLLSFVL